MVTFEGRFTFIEPAPLELALEPGRNLISLPFTPADPSVNAVVPADHTISLVLAYDGATQTWQVSRRDAASGLPVGEVTVMTATTGYFVLTDPFEPLKLFRPSSTTAIGAQALPAISVVKGWNLVPVLSDVPLPTNIPADIFSPP